MGGHSRETAPSRELVPVESEATMQLTVFGAPGPEEILAEPLDAQDIAAELSAPPRRKLPWLSLLLVGGMVAGFGFAGGAYFQKSSGTGTSSSGLPGGATRPSGGGGYGGYGAAGGFGGGAPGGGTGTGAAAAATTGTVKLVDGNTVYLTTSDGTTVKVTTGSTTKVTTVKSGKTADLTPGQSVTVAGTTDSSGTVAATTVTEG